MKITAFNDISDLKYTSYSFHFKDLFRVTVTNTSWDSSREFFWDSHWDSPRIFTRNTFTDSSRNTFKNLSRISPGFLELLYKVFFFWQSPMIFFLVSSESSQNFSQGSSTQTSFQNSFQGFYPDCLRDCCRGSTLCYYRDSLQCSFMGLRSPTMVSSRNSTKDFSRNSVCNYLNSSRNLSWVLLGFFQGFHSQILDLLPGFFFPDCPTHFTFNY